MNFQENLVRARKARGLSQEDLAARVGVSRQAVSKWETGDAAPDLGKLLALAEALEMSLDDLCGRGSSVPDASDAAEEPLATPKPKKRSWLLPALCGFLVAALLAGGLWAWSRRDVEQASEAPAESSLPEAFTVSGVHFTPPDTPGGQMLGCSFTPSVSGGEWTYQITFTDGSGASKTVDAVCEGGACTGSAFLDKYESYTVTASIVDGKGNRRNAAIAMDVSFSQGRVSWLPIEE